MPCLRFLNVGQPLGELDICAFEVGDKGDAQVDCLYAFWGALKCYAHSLKPGSKGLQVHNFEPDMIDGRALGGQRVAVAIGDSD